MRSILEPHSSSWSSVLLPTSRKHEPHTKEAKDALTMAETYATAIQAIAVTEEEAVCGLLIGPGFDVCACDVSRPEPQPLAL